jgi:UDP-N-acetylmuramoyl-tripeptide--D-alanyl-D-alanine ligase
MSAMLNLSQIIPWLTGAHLVGARYAMVLRVHTDTRTIAPGDLFVALKGDRFDANEFLAEALARGAVAAICHAGASAQVQGLPCIEVPDTKIALGELATAWRRQFNIPLIAVTGSNGKTTVTQMLASILNCGCPYGQTLATQGNLNNDIGVPLTLLRMRAAHKMAVVELGMNHPGEIAALARMAQPTVALVNNAQREHLEFMHTVEAVAQENGAVIAALDAQGVAVFPSDDSYSAVWLSLAGQRRVATFSLEQTPSSTGLFCAQAQWDTGAWEVHAQGLGVDLRYRLAIAGKHNVKNSLAAAACALSAGVSVQAVEQGLGAFSPVKGRSRALPIQWAGRDITLVDDTYNANPDSVRSAIDVLAGLPSPRLLVLGDMGEVGLEGPQFHAEAGRYAQTQGIEQVLTFGALARHAADSCAGARHCSAMAELNAAVLDLLPAVNSVLVKGSRFMRMERVVEAVVAADQGLKEKALVH